MGEIAEMMLEGDLCEMCGVYLDGDGQGFPRYCSKECALDRNMGVPNIKSSEQYKSYSALLGQARGMKKLIDNCVGFRCVIYD